MRSHRLALALALAAVGSIAAQPRQTSPAVPHYRTGMQLLAHEYWDEAADAFKRAIAADDQYALAYYGLGRAEMGRKDSTGRAIGPRSGVDTPRNRAPHLNSPPRRQAVPGCGHWFVSV